MTKTLFEMTTQFKLGDRVSFKGTRHPERPGDFVSLSEDGPDTFEATITECVMGICWTLRWDDGSPLGLPFHDYSMTLVHRAGTAVAAHLRRIRGREQGR